MRWWGSEGNVGKGFSAQQSDRSGSGAGAFSREPLTVALSLYPGRKRAQIVSHKHHTPHLDHALR